MTKDNTYSNAGGAQMQALMCQRLAAVARHLASNSAGAYCETLKNGDFPSTDRRNTDRRKNIVVRT
jgi:hypothetical protein